MPSKRSEFEPDSKMCQNSTSNPNTINLKATMETKGSMCKGVLYLKKLLIDLKLELSATNTINVSRILTQNQKNKEIQSSMREMTCYKNLSIMCISSYIYLDFNLRAQQLNHETSSPIIQLEIKNYQTIRVN